MVQRPVDPFSGGPAPLDTDTVWDDEVTDPLPGGDGSDRSISSD